MKRVLVIAFVLAGCSDPAPADPAAPEINGEAVRVHVGGREVVVHCALTCDAMRTEMTHISTDCRTNPASRPHLLATGTGVLTLGCCQEAAAAYEHGCGHEGLADCMVSWSSECQGTSVRMPAIDDGDRGVAPARGAEH